MHKLFIIGLNLFVVSFLLAQGQPSEYLRRKMLIEVEGQIIASYTDWDNFITKSLRVGGGTLTLNRIRTWKAYQGGIELSEWDFFNITGFPEQSKKALEYHKRQSCIV